MTDKDWSRRLRAGVVELDDAGHDEQNRQQEDDNAHERQCTTSESTDYAEIFCGICGICGKTRSA